MENTFGGKITEKKEKENQNIINYILNTAPIFIWSLDKGEKFTMTKGGKMHFHDIVGRYLSEVYKEYPKIVEYNRRALAGESVKAIIRFNDWIGESFFKPLKNESDEIIGATGVAVDITEYKNVMEKFQKSEKEAKNYFDVSGVILVVVNSDGVITRINKKGCDLLGYSKNQITGKNWFDSFIPQRYRRKIRENFQGMLNAEIEPIKYAENNIITKDGNERVIAWHNKIIKDENGNNIATLSSGEDITERKKVEEKLKESEEKFRIISEQSLMGIMIHQDHYVIYANNAAADIYEHKIEEMMNWEQYSIPEKFVHPEDRDFVREQGRKKESGEEGYITNYSLRIIPHPGIVKWIEIYSKTIIYHGKAANLVTIIDINENKKTGEKLKERERELNIILESITDNVIYYNDSGLKIVWANKAAAESVNILQDQMIGKYCYELWQQITEPCENCPILKAFKTGQPEQNEHKTHDERVWDVRGFPVNDEDGKIIGCVQISRNITKQKQAEEMLFKNQRMESISLLAGGIAHDFNNLLTSILGNLSLLKLDINQNDEKYSTLIEAEKATFRARNLTHQLLTFSKGGEPIKKITSIEEVIIEYSNFALHGSPTTIEFDISQDLWHVNIDVGQIGQVIQNLVINAVQSMSKSKGTITISAINVILNPNNLVSLQQGKYVRVSFNDMGCGIPEENIQKIFNPYFSTKEKGSGLGLATSYSIIKRHYGGIYVDSKVGEGTTVTLYIPAQLGAQVPIHISEELPLNGKYKGRVLILEDDSHVNRLIGSMLKRIGFKSEITIDGFETISAYKTAIDTGNPFDVVILDLTISGGMGGRETIQRLLEIDPDVKAIISSGYATGKIISNYKKFGFKGVLKKPYTILDLREELRKITHGA
ncbi:MAG: PAS domain-containing hybrid sensor histidine kinase/response regulator [Promethearchaeota archaeon]